jgi:hypothetical protein
MSKKTQTNNRQSAFMSMLNTNKDDNSQENQEIAQIENVKNEISQNQNTQLQVSQIEKTQNLNTQNDPQNSTSNRSNLIRKTVHLTEDQLEKLKRLRRKLKLKDFEIESLIFDKVFSDPEIFSKIFGEVKV